MDHTTSPTVWQCKTSYSTGTTTRYRKPFVQMPAQAGSLPLPVQGFFRLILEDSGFDGYTTTPVKILAMRAGISRKTAFKYMAILASKEHRLVARVWVDGEYRTYHADQRGVLTLPGEAEARTLRWRSATARALRSCLAL